MRKKDTAFHYASLVLFPETFIHHQEKVCKTREEAEKFYLESGKDEEYDEMVALKAEVKAAARRKEQEEKAANRKENGKEENEWVDHSDCED